MLWKRLTASFDDAIKVFAANPAIAAPLTRLVFFEHLTKTQGMAGREYASIVRHHARYSLPAGVSRTARSANLQPMRAEDQELERRINNCTMDEYEREARKAKRMYRRAMKVLDGFRDPVTGRNVAKDLIDSLCLEEVEPPSESRAGIGIVLTMMAKEFGIGGEKRRG